ncbi:MAG: response regulator [Rariglobus sp.]|nr:response regulator [Rariglobus sp.]
MPHILLIEDDTLLRGMLKDQLEEMGHTVTEAGDGKEGLVQQALAPADLVLTDLIMPEKEGIETIMELRKKWPGVKIIAMSGGGRVTAASYLSIASRMGAGAVLNKPFSSYELETAICSLLPTSGR